MTSIRNLPRKSTEAQTMRILREKQRTETHAHPTKLVTKPYIKVGAEINPRLPGMPALPNRDDLFNRLHYVPSRDNPQQNVRPGADDHKRYQSVVGGTSSTYRDRGHV